MSRIFTQADIDNVVELYQSGKGIAEVATITHHDSSVIRRFLRENGIAQRIPVNARKTLDVDAIVDRYLAGESVNALAKAFGVSRSAITRRLNESDVIIRGQTQANQLMMSKRTPEQNQKFTQAAHDSVRGKPHSYERLCRKAQNVQRNFTEFKSPYESDLADELTRLGIEFVPQLAVGKYNIDFGIGDNIALEVYGGGWHSSGRARARFNERSEYLFNCGYAIIICWALFSIRFDAAAIAEYIIALSDKLRSDPSARCKHYVIGCDGKPSSVGQSHLDYKT